MFSVTTTPTPRRLEVGDDHLPCVTTSVGAPTNRQRWFRLVCGRDTDPLCHRPSLVLTMHLPKWNTYGVIHPIWSYFSNFFFSLLFLVWNVFKVFTKFLHHCEHIPLSVRVYNESYLSNLFLWPVMGDYKFYPQFLLRGWLFPVNRKR